MVVELFKLVGEEIAADPMTFAIEVVQFLILVVLVWAVAWGFGKRRGMLRNMLTERQNRVARQLEESDTAEDVLASAREQAQVSVREAQKTAKHDVVAARKRADGEFAAAKAATDREVDGMRDHAGELLEMERAEMLEHSRERLLDVVGRATRYILSEGLSPAEQRSLIQHSIMESLNGNGSAGAAQNVAEAGATASGESRPTDKPRADASAAAATG